MKNSARKKIVALLGCGGHARSIADVIITDRLADEIVFVDDNAKLGEQIMGYKVIKYIPENITDICPALGDNHKRKALCEKNHCVSIISKTAHIGILSRVEDGCFIAKGVHIGPQVRIGFGSIVNTRAVVEHNCSIGNYCHIAPNTTLCGNVVLGDNVFIGAGSTIKNNISICSGAIVGMGATVVSDITERGIYIGCPAKRKK